MSSLVENLLSSFDAGSVLTMSQQLGLDPQTTGKAIQSALPLLLGQMARNSAQPEGASALLNAAREDHASVNTGNLLGNLLGALGGGGAPQASGGLGDGLAILGHVFGGSQQQPAAPTVAGLDAARSMKLLAMLAPLVMSTLGKMSQQNAVNANSLSGLLGQESQRVQQAPPSAIEGLLGAVLGGGQQQAGGGLDLGSVAKTVGALGSLFGKKN